VTETRPAAPTAAELTARFDAPAPLSVGVEEEVMLLDPRSLDLAPRAQAVLARLRGDPRYKRELPASQLEITGPPAASIDELAAALRESRAALAAAGDGLVRLAAAGVHPSAAVHGDLHGGGRLDRLAAEYGPVARLQLVCGLHVHVRLTGADRTLAVYNALRAYLPELAALAANAPIYAGRLTGLASVRPTIAATLPRQGIPPALASWGDYADELGWGLAAGRLGAVGEWWWELRPHPVLGTLEIRVADAQTTAGEAATVAAATAALAVWLGRRHDAGDLPPAPPEWRIRENRWSAARHGLDGTLADLETGRRQPTADRLHAVLEEIAPAFDADRHRQAAHALAERNGAIRQAEVAAAEGVDGLVRWLADRFLAAGSV
jgi:carboxylate-amine ligase